MTEENSLAVLQSVYGKEETAVKADPETSHAQLKEIYGNDPKLETADGRYKISDADTIIDKKNGKIYRLAGIDSAETSTEFGREQTKRLKKLLDENPDFTVEEGETDRTGRTLGVLRSRDGVDLNAIAVQQGLGRATNFGGKRQYADERKGSVDYLEEHDPELQRQRDMQILRGLDPDVRYQDQRERKPKTTLGNEFAKGVSRGTDSLQGAGYGAIALVGSALNLDSVRDYGMKHYRRNEREGAAAAPDVSFKEMEFGENFFDWAAGALGEAAPSMATMITGGGIGAQVGRGFVKRSVERHVTNKAAEAMTKLGVGEKAALGWVEKSLASEATHKALYNGAMRGATGMAGATSAIPQQGSIFAEIYEEAGVEAPGTALIGGGLAGALDTIPFGVLTRKLFPGMEKEVVKNLLLETMKVSGKQTLIEGSTEAMQEFIANVSRAIHDDSFDPLGEEAMDRVYAAAATGALVGAVSGGVAGPFSAKKEAKETKDDGTDEPGAGTEVVDEEVAPPAAEPATKPDTKAEAKPSTKTEAEPESPPPAETGVASVDEERVIKGLQTVLSDERAIPLYQEIAKKAVAEPDKDPLTPEIKERLIKAQAAQPLRAEEIPETAKVMVKTTQRGKEIQVEMPAREAVEAIDKELGVYQRLAKCLQS